MAPAPASVTVQVDCQIAFNTLRRDKMLAAVQQRCPALLPLATWAYGRHSHHIVQQSPGAVVSSQSWVRQGDPLGPLLFAITLQGPLEEVAAMDLARPLAYADDTFLQGAPAPTMQAFVALTALAAPLGLHTQPAKSAVYSTDGAAAASVAGHLGVRHAPDGLLAAGTPAGTPVGTPAFQTTHADSCAAHACYLMEELLALPLGDQDRWLSLQGSLQKRVAHLPRGYRWEHVGPAVQSAENKAVDCAFAIAANPRTNGPLTDQITLPLRHGGLGLARTGPPEGAAAYLAAAATTQLAMQGGPTQLRPFDGPSGEQLRPLWETLHDTAVGLWPPEDHEASPDTMGIIAEAQRAFSRHSSQARADALHPFPKGVQTTRSAPHMQEWSQTATPSSSSLWSRTDVSDNRR
jgi:hypothetical protein